VCVVRQEDAFSLALADRFHDPKYIWISQHFS